MKKFTRQTSGNAPTADVNLDFGAASAKVARLFEPGEYRLRIDSARIIQNNQNVSISCTAPTGPGSEIVISSQQIGTATGIGKSAAYRAMIAALDLGFLTNNETRPGKPFRLTLKQGVDDAGPSLLPDPNTITQESGAA
jgi:hypothetical protein